MLKSKLAIAGSVCAALLLVQQASAEVLLSASRPQPQGVYNYETMLSIELGGSRAVFFSTTVARTLLAIELSATCAIGNSSQSSYVDMDIIVDGIAVGITSLDAPLCSMINSPVGYLGVTQSVSLSTSVSVAAGAHSLQVQARIMPTTTTTTQAVISALHINVIR